MTTLLAALASLLMSAPATPGLVVLEYQSKGILDKTVLRNLWERTHEMVAAAAPGRVLDAAETRKRLFDQSILVPARCDQACLLRVADKLQARELLVPTVEKNGDVVKLTFQVVNGRSGAVTAQTVSGSDGRIGMAIESGVRELFKGGAASSEDGIPTEAWTAAGVLAAGAGLVIVLGLDAPDTPANTPVAPAPPPIFEVVDID